MGFSHYSTGNAAGDPKRVVVIGAGFAGLAAANALARVGPGVQVTVLEALQRVGGRAWTKELEFGEVEMGPTWFHGVEGHPLFELAVKEGIMTKKALKAAGLGARTQGEEDKPHQGAQVSTATSDEHTSKDALHTSPTAGAGVVAAGADKVAAGAMAAASADKAVAGANVAAIGADGVNAGADVPAASADVAGAGTGADEVEFESDSWLSEYWMAGTSAPLSGRQHELAGRAFYLYSKAMEAVESTDVDGKSAVGDIVRAKFQQAVSDLALQGEDLDVFAAAWQNRQQLQYAIDGYWSIDDVSVAHVKAYSDLPGPQIPVPGGYQALAKLLARDLDVQFGWRVAGVDYSSTAAAPVRIHSTDGREVVADAAIVTVSLGVLQAHHGSIFTPALPPSKVEALHSLRLGVADKFFFQFVPPQSSSAAAPAAMQPDGRPAVQQDKVLTTVQPAGAGTEAAKAVSEEEEEESLEVQAAGLLWPVVAEELGPNLVHPYITAGGGNTLSQEDVGTKVKPPYDNVTPDEAGPISPYNGTPAKVSCLFELAYGNTFHYINPHRIKPTNSDGTPRHDYFGVSFITGYGALQLEQLDGDQLQRSFREVLGNFPLPPEMDATWELKVYSSAWATDPLFYGSYSYIGVGADEGAVEELGEPLRGGDGRPLVCFAGEATHPKYMGTTHGAYLSGEREAKRLLDAWGLATHLEVPRSK